MKEILAKFTRQPVLLTGVVTSGLGLLVLFGVDLTEKQIGGVVLFLGAVMALVSSITTPSKEVAVQVVQGEVVAGPAAVERTGSTVNLPNGNDAVVAIKPNLLE